VRTGDQIVQDLPWRWRVQGKIFLIAGIGYMFDAWDVTLNGFLTPLLGNEFGLAAGERGLVATANLAGLAIGAVVWGTIADRLGRKKAFSLTLLVFAISSVLAAFSPTWPVFLVLRFVAGLGLGGCIPVDWALVSEFCPRRQRGRVLTTMDAWWPIGATLCGVSATLLAPVAGNWRWMLAVFVLPALLVFWVRRGVPESPLYLARTGQEAAARAVIDDLVRRTGADPQPYAIVAATTVTRQRRGFGVVLEQLRAVWSFSPRVTAVAWTLFVTVLLVYYGALSWLPSILRAEGAGDVAAFFSATITNAVGIVGVVVSALLVERVGRKWLIGVSAPLAAAALVVFALVLHMPAAATVSLVVFGSVIFVTIPTLYAYISELYPTDLRASGFGWASAASRVVTGFVPLIFGTLLWPVLGLPLTFGLFAVVVLAAVVFMAFAAPETRGRSLDHVLDPTGTKTYPDR
jgi:putative MFS transporter